MPGTMTYGTNSNEVYTARVNGTGQVEHKLLFKVPLTQSDTAQIIDVIVTENFTVVRYDNFTVATYLRPKVVGGFAILTRTGQLHQPSTVDSAVFAISPFVSGLTANQSLQLVVVQNQNSNNQLNSYAIIQTYSAQGVLLDVPIMALTTMNLQSLIISSLQISQSSIILGCAQCNTYRGRLDVYNRLATGGTLMKIGQIDGTSDN